jgi:hypothetical protein
MTQRWDEGSFFAAVRDSEKPLIRELYNFSKSTGLILWGERKTPSFGVKISDLVLCYPFIRNGLGYVWFPFVTFRRDGRTALQSFIERLRFIIGARSETGNPSCPIRRLFENEDFARFKEAVMELKRSLQGESCS